MSDSKAIAAASEEERRRIARELHDETVQRLSALSRQTDSRLRKRDDAFLREIKDEIDLILVELRRIIQDLRPSVLDDLGLVPALRSLAKSKEVPEDLTVDVAVSGEERRLDADTELMLYRIVQEALSNVRKHAQATQASVTLEFGPDQVKVTISDNGRGFQRPTRLETFARSGKFGLAGMEERARLAGGRLHVSSRIGRGTTITVEAQAP